MNAYAYWTDALAGKKPKMFVDDPQCGFYRKGTYVRNERGNKSRSGWETVAIFMDAGQLTAVIGADGTHMGNGMVGELLTDPDKINELWSYVAGNPISEEWYRAVAERGKPWPDAHDATRNKPVAHPVPEGATAASPENVLADQIAAAKAGVSQYDKIESDEQSGRARSLQSELLGFKGEVVKLHKAEKEPYLEAGRAVDRKWFPLRDDADVAALTLRKAMEGWEDQKLAMASLSTGEKSNVPSPSTQISGAVGRKASVRVKSFVVSIDEDEAFKQFKGSAELSQILLTLAQRAVDRGLTVNGAVLESRSIVR